MQLKRFFINPFSKFRIGISKFRTFCENHIANLTANNGGGLFTAMIAETSNLYTSLFGAYQDEDIARAAQKSLTAAKDIIFVEFKDKVSQKEGTIRGQFCEGTPEYLLFFPNGLSEYSNATMANVALLMSRMRETSQLFIAELGQPFADIWSDIDTRYTAARTAQLNQKGTVQTAITNEDAARSSMDVKLFSNLLKIADIYPDQPERCNDFFDETMLPGDGGEDEPGNGGGTPPVNP